MQDVSLHEFGQFFRYFFLGGRFNKHSESKIKYHLINLYKYKVECRSVCMNTLRFQKFAYIKNPKPSDSSQVYAIG